jgi:tetratricopeptide (TPR) repeat protein
MSYPGNSGLSVQAQERVMTAFKQVLTNLQAGQREEAMIGLEFVLRLDPSFVPATNLKRQLASSSDEIDLGDVIAQLQAPTTEAINTLLIEAVDDFNSREFLAAKEKVEKVLIDLPGHQEARDLRDQIDKALKIENQVGQFLIQAREALGNGDPQEAANFVMMAQALDPHHTGIATTLKEINDVGGITVQPPEATAAPEPGSEPSVAAEAPPVATVPEAGPERPDAATSQPAFEPEADESDAFAVDFDTTDPFADIIESETEPEAAEPSPSVDFSGTDNVSFPPMDDTADLFTAPADDGFSGGPAAAAEAYAASESTPDDDDEAVATTIQSLIEGGRAAADDGDLAQAISTWSRIFLIKPEHPEASRLIDRARKRFTTAEGETEALLGKARDAFDEREFDAARLLVNKALAIRPNHLGVTLLLEEIERERGSDTASARADAPQPTAEASPPDAVDAVPELPDLDDDLFSDPTAKAAETDEVTENVAADDELFDDELDFEDFGDLGLFDRLKRRLSMRLVAVAAVALVVVLAGVWLGGRTLSSEPEVDDATRINEVLIEAERLFKERKTEEALHLLREFPAEGLGRKRIEMRIAKYEESLAPPTPTPVPEEASRAEALFAEGQWWAAYQAAKVGLEAHPDDTGLSTIRSRIDELEPEAAVLENSLRVNDFKTAVSITEDLLGQYPGQPDLVALFERCLFNAALAESRAYNLTGAENHLVRLLESQPDDDEAEKFLEFVRKYKVRSADMRLEIFIRSMNER